RPRSWCSPLLRRSPRRGSPGPPASRLTSTDRTSSNRAGIGSSFHLLRPIVSRYAKLLQDRLRLEPVLQSCPHRDRTLARSLEDVGMAGAWSLVNPTIAARQRDDLAATHERTHIRSTAYHNLEVVATPSLPAPPP